MKDFGVGEISLGILCVIAIFYLLRHLEKLELSKVDEPIVSDYQLRVQELRKTVPESIMDQYLVEQREVTLLYNKGIITKEQSLYRLTKWLEANNG